MIESRTSTSTRNRMITWCVVLGVVALVVQTSATGSIAPEVDPPSSATTESQVDSTVATSGKTETAFATDDSAKTAQQSTKNDPVSRYGWWVLLPALAAIFLAVITRQVIPALLCGTFVGALMMLPCQEAGLSWLQPSFWIHGVATTIETYVIKEAILSSDHVMIMVFTLVIGFMVGVIGRSGGTAGIVSLVAGRTASQRRSGVAAYLAGLVVFFDDYANTMIVGPTMRSVFDKVKLSRAKLAYIVDSTAAPVASIALIGTWVGAEIGFIDAGLKALPIDTDPQLLFLKGVDPMTAFIQSIPYRSYPLLALLLVFLVTVTRRDFGPMRKSEARARQTGSSDGDDLTSVSADASTKARPLLGLLPILLLVGTTLAVLGYTGWHSPDTVEAVNRTASLLQPGWADQPWYGKAAVVIGNADSYRSILYGAFAAAVGAALLAFVARACSIKATMDAGLEGMSRMFPAVVVLILAWALSAVSTDLCLGEVVRAKLQAGQFSACWLPLAVFVSAAFISFATGTSWGTMGILCPVTVTVAAGLVSEFPPDQALHLFYASIGSVLAGAIFGDHCSPISDTTVLSSLAAGCPHEEHVWTQIPYALVTAVIAMICGDILTSVFNQPWYTGLALGSVVLVVIVLVVGKRPDHLSGRAVPHHS